VLAGTDASIPLAKIALAIADASALEGVCTALEAGRLNRSSTAAIRAAIADGNTKVESLLRGLQEAWTSAGAELSAETVALVLRTSVASVAAFRQKIPVTEVVWTGPKVEGSFLRASREVVREILRDANTELLVVGYWIAARDDGEGIIEEVITSLAYAIMRGVTVTVVVDERVRQDGRDNRGILISAWPLGAPLPKLLTWRLPPGDQHLKLHAKVVVADRRDALVTSANLTSHAMDRNMEMGVRIVGRPAVEIAKHFDLLAADGVLEAYPEERDLR
jgi:cardiolipin synthase A/B